MTRVNVTLATRTGPHAVHGWALASDAPLAATRGLSPYSSRRWVLTHRATGRRVGSREYDTRAQALAVAAKLADLPWHRAEGENVPPGLVQRFRTAIAQATP